MLRDWTSSRLGAIEDNKRANSISPHDYWKVEPVWFCSLLMLPPQSAIPALTMLVLERDPSFPEARIRLQTISVFTIVFPVVPHERTRCPVSRIELLNIRPGILVLRR